MANLCENELTITGSPTAISEIKDKLNKKAESFLFYETLLGEIISSYYSKEGKESYGYPSDAWFDMGENYIESCEDSISVWFDSRWSPSLDGSKAVCEKYDVEITHAYAECGCDFSGVAEITKDTFVDNEFENGYYDLNNELVSEDNRDMANGESLKDIMELTPEEFNEKDAFDELIRLADLDVDYVHLIEENPGFEMYVKYIANKCKESEYDEPSLGFSEEDIKRLESVCIKDMLFDAVLDELSNK